MLPYFIKIKIAISRGLACEFPICRVILMNEVNGDFIDSYLDIILKSSIHFFPSVSRFIGTRNYFEICKQFSCNGFSL